MADLTAKKLAVALGLALMWAIWKALKLGACLVKRWDASRVTM